MSDANNTPVHCDATILHAPGECGFCDEYGKAWQEYRQMARINFTGHTDEDKAPCPSTHFRPTEVAHRWEGNQPKSLDYYADQAKALEKTIAEGIVIPQEGLTISTFTSDPVWRNADGTTSPIQPGT